MQKRKVVDQKIGQIGSVFARDTINAELDLVHERLNRIVERGDRFISRKTISSTYNMVGDDSYLGVDCSLNKVTIILPSVDDVINNRVYTIKDESNSAATNNITLVGYNGETIDKATTKTISSNCGVLTVFFTGTEWFSL